MKQKKKSLLEKIVKKDYNNELENILEKKNFDENAKSTLLSILYKIEASYKDLEIVKKDVENKEEYMSNLFNDIKDDCNLIEIIKMSDNQNKIPENKTYIINKSEKTIISYPIERKILYAIAKISKKDEIIKDNYFVINETLSDLINVGNNINMVEPLRDFNGYSWTTIPNEIESINHNLIYQNLRIMVGSKFLNNWVKNNEYIIDYYDLFNEELVKKYGKEIKKKVIDTLTKISILLSIKFDKDMKEKLNSLKSELKSELRNIENKEEFIEEATSKKIIITKKIKEIDKIINNKKLLQEEYEERNRHLPLVKKIFSMRVLEKMMENERQEAISEMEELNKILNPKNFTKYKKELEEKFKILEILNTEDKEKELEKQIKNFQKLFLNIMEINLNKAQTKQEVEKIIYDLRYYLLLPYNNNENIQDILDLKNRIEHISKAVINKAIELKVIERISKDDCTNYEILKNIFNVRIIKLEDAYLKVIKEKDKYFVQIFDENIFEEKVEIKKPKQLEIKPNKKVPIWY